MGLFMLVVAGNIMLISPDDTVDRLKACLVAKGYTQTCGVYYFETCSPFAILNTVEILIPIAINMNWTLLQLDVKTCFCMVNLRRKFKWSNCLGLLLIGELRKVCCLRKSMWTKKIP